MGVVEVTPAVEARAAPVLSRGVRFVFAVLVVCLGVSLFSEEVGGLLAPLGMVVGYATASLIIWRRSSVIDRREQIAWRFVAGGLALVAIGVVVVGVIDTVAPGGAPAFGFSDIFFLTAYVMLLTGLSFMPQMSGNSIRRIRLLLDSLIGGVSVGVVLWIYEIRGLVSAHPGAPLSDQIIAVAYPIVDLAAIVIVTIVLVRRSEFRFDPRLVLFAAGASLQAGADIAYLEAIGRSFEEVPPLFPILLLAAMAFLGSAVLVQRRPKPREYADRDVSILWMMAPYAAAAVMVGLLIFEVSTGSFTGNARLLLFGALTVGVLVFLRQSAAIRENRALVESQRATLVSSISHELRTPLTAMVGFLSLLANPEVDSTLTADEKAELLSTVYAQSTYMSRIVHDLVLLARGTLDLIELQKSPTDLRDLVSASVASADEGRQELVVDVADELQVLVDADRVRQILVNLLSNANRYGGDKVAVIARAEGSILHIDVHDDGPGVPKKFELAIWEQFERGPNRLNATVPGSGIGLAVVEAMARSHGGSADYRKSERLGGACFSITFPGAVIGSDVPTPFSTDSLPTPSETDSGGPVSRSA